MSAKMYEYPGWNKDLRWTDQRRGERRDATYPMGIHYNCHGAESEMLLMREVAMMLVMDRLTDKPDWHVKVFNDEIADKWRQEALAWPNDDLYNRIINVSTWPNMSEDMLSRWVPTKPKDILNKESVDYCILELREKAKYFERTGVIPTLDATHSIAKSDSVVSTELHSALRDAFSRLQADQASNRDWHPNTDEIVQDLVHPSMYPLVYGRSLFHPEEVVGVEDAIDKWAGKGEVIPRRPEWGEEPTQRNNQGFRYGGSNDYGTSIGGSGIHKSYWSTIYQWLPANLTFTDDGSVKFSSYINNLHPTKYSSIYKDIEKLIEVALPLWDQCLAQYQGYRTIVGAGRHHPRIVPDNADDENGDNWDPKSPEEMLAKERAATGEPPRQLEESAAEGEEDLEDTELNDEEELDDYWGKPPDIARWMNTRQPIFPQPPPFSESRVNYAINPESTLRSQFKESGLQIIVKMASIELTPEKPEFPPGGWHVEGQMNEHIVGTALFYLDSENITDSHLDFRTLTSSYQDDWGVGQDSFHWMQSVYGARLAGGSGSACVQNYGSVVTCEGRLLAFPNVFQHRVSGFKLADPTKPGHRRFIALWLVDPFTRIISTANVPPQQAEWWEDRVLGGEKGDGVELATSMPPEIALLLLEKGIGKGRLDKAMATGKLAHPKLPQEVLDMVHKELGEALPMSREEAEEHRRKLMSSRSAFQEEARGGWASVEYSFCEH
ncbi:glucose-methanol-choline oxidoreductase [Coniochaeta hoffmannii]|uniref:Glucose-methanol-choline oxidoreductase n=1 Tax=Coniochaeta hoffmannii TaxID=91930 RepID=A0AA38S7A9_9PEZI|nr:glucose-methanol-choline oxidoreductase [Coniochaeta hoffmannii]